MFLLEAIKCRKYFDMFLLEAINAVHLIFFYDK